MRRKMILYSHGISHVVYVIPIGDFVQAYFYKSKNMYLFKVDNF